MEESNTPETHGPEMGKGLGRSRKALRLMLADVGAAQRGRDLSPRVIEATRQEAARALAHNRARSGVGGPAPERNLSLSFGWLRAVGSVAAGVLIMMAVHRYQRDADGIGPEDARQPAEHSLADMDRAIEMRKEALSADMQRLARHASASGPAAERTAFPEAARFRARMNHVRLAMHEEMPPARQTMETATP